MSIVECGPLAEVSKIKIDNTVLQVTRGADLFIGYGGVVERPAVAAAADWFVYDHKELLSSMQRYQVCTTL
jgi:glycerol-3-phosphate dehydrogenase (NAD+)